MEPRVMPSEGRPGFMLVMVLAITAIGLLFGAGALLLFRYQCQLRIDRQHELEKVFAVRSALNYVRTMSNNSDIHDDGKWFTYHTASERNLKLLVKPVSTIFPNANDARHFVMERGEFPSKPNDIGGQQQSPDYEYGANGVTNILMGNKSSSGKWGLGFEDVLCKSNATWWANVGMPGTGGWLQEDYGRRYYFYPYDYVQCGATQDIVRLCIIRNVTNESNTVGRRRGWPLTQRGERAIVFQINSRVGDSTNNADMVLYEYHHTGTATNIHQLGYWRGLPSTCYMGLQLASDKVSMFYVSNREVNSTSNDSADDKTLGFTFSGTMQITAGTYDYFASPVTVGGQPYGGIYTNAEGRVRAPELRAVFEVERRNCDEIKPSSRGFLSYFRVKPAYQYDVYIEHPESVLQRATVAQKMGIYKRGGLSYSVFTYDTHGTDHKGFRYDEKHAGENK